MKLRQLLLHWKICIADTHFSIFDIIAVANSSPIRDQVRAFSKLHKLTFTDITEYLELLLELNMKKAPKKLQALLKKFQGRPKFFFSFMEDLLRALAQEKFEQVNELFNKMKVQAEESLEDSKETMKRILNKYMMENRAFGAKTERTTRKLVAQIFIAAVFERKEHIEIDDKDVNADVVAKGLMMSSSARANQSYRKKDEIIFFEALEESELDFVSDYLVNPCAVLNYLQSTKGVATEYLLTWYFLKTVRRHGPQSLHDLLTGITPPDFTILGAWQNVMVATRRGWPTSRDVPATDVIGLVDDKDYTSLQYAMNQSVGPDLFFLVKVTKERKNKSVTRMGAVAIQCKARQTFQFADALRSVQLGYLWTEKGQRAIIDEHWKANGNEDDVEITLSAAQKKSFKNLRNQRRKIYERIESRSSLAKHWFRVVYSSQLWPAKIVAAVNAYNTSNPFTPVILVTLTEKLFGEEAREMVKANEETKFLPDPRTPDLLFVDHSTAKKIDEAIESDSESEEDEDDEEEEGEDEDNEVSED